MNISKDRIDFDIYIHETHKTSVRIKQVIAYWSSITGFSIDKFDKIYYKRNKIFSNRKNIDYFGLLRIKVKKSTDLNRKITGWIEGIYIQCGIV